jgi:L-aminopeptidase/D-esterase-like protein
MPYTRRQFTGSLALGTIGALGSGARALAGEREPGQAAGARGGSLTDVPGITVGHWTDTRRPTGCTAILFDQAVAAAGDYSSSAPAESMGVLLQLVSPVERIHGMFLTGGGMFGVAAAGGVVRFLEEHRVGFDWGTPDLRIPIVVTGAIDDLALGDPRIRPDADAAYKACATATSGAVVEGNVGAGAGATVGKMHRTRGFSGMKGGIGSASIRIGDVVIGALAVVNAAGDVLDWRSGRIVAGARRPDGTFVDSVEVMQAMLTGPAGGAVQDPVLGSTTIVVVATNVDLPKPTLEKVASMANCGGARAIRPYHTTGDGDQLFALSTRKILRPDLQVTVIGALAADVVADAIVRAVRAAKSVDGWPGLGGM